MTDIASTLSGAVYRVSCGIWLELIQKGEWLAVIDSVKGRVGERVLVLAQRA